MARHPPKRALPSRLASRRCDNSPYWTLAERGIYYGNRAVAGKLPSGAGCAQFVVVSLLGIRFVPHLPPPSGPFHVGTVLWRIDGFGTDSLLSARVSCPVSVQLWYPAAPGTGDGRAPYRPAGLLSAARWVRTGATLSAALSPDRMRYPVLLSVPGWAGSRVENTTFLQDLASRGFIVAGIGYDDPACAGVDRSSGDAAATDMDFSSQAAFERTLGVANRKIARVAEAASHVIDALEVLDRVDPNGRFGGRLDLDRIGVVGYSLGGAIAMQLCWRDNRLRAAVNVGGWLFDAARGGWIDQPFTIIADEVLRRPLLTSATRILRAVIGPY